MRPIHCRFEDYGVPSPLTPSGARGVLPRLPPTMECMGADEVIRLIVCI